MGAPSDTLAGLFKVHIPLPRKGTAFGHANGGELFVETQSLTDWVRAERFSAEDSEGADVLRVEYLVPDTDGVVHRLTTYVSAHTLWQQLTSNVLSSERDFFGAGQTVDDLDVIVSDVNYFVDDREDQLIRWRMKPHEECGVGDSPGPYLFSLVRRKYFAATINVYRNAAGVTIFHDLYSATGVHLAPGQPLFRGFSFSNVLWPNRLQVQRVEEPLEDVTLMPDAPRRFEDTYESWPLTGRDGKFYELRWSTTSFPLIFETTDCTATPQAGVCFREE